MATEIKVPTLGESVTEATIGQWFKSEGDAVAADEPLVELETDKVTVEVPAPAAGVLQSIAAKDGETVEVGALLGAIGEGDGTEAPPASAQASSKPSSKPAGKADAKSQREREGEKAPADPARDAAEQPSPDKGGELTDIVVPSAGESVTEADVGQWFKKEGEAVARDEALVELETDKASQELAAQADGVLVEILKQAGETVEVGDVLGRMRAGAGGEQGPAGAAEGAEKDGKPKAAAEPAVPEKATRPAQSATPPGRDMPPSPAARKLATESGLSANVIAGTGRRGQVLKGDVLEALEKGPAAAKSPEPAPPRAPSAPDDEAREERVKMTRLRQTIARRLKQAQDTAAMLTTFNEVDMSAVMALRSEYRDLFEKKHGVKLGFMGFFTKAVCHALEEIPAVNAEIDGTDIVYKRYCHIGVAVGTDKGLVVPVVRDAHLMSIAEVEKAIGLLGRKARDGELSLEEMQGGTFTISNGGVYGSLMSTPILNAPQSGILGMHKIQERPVVVGGEVKVRPMMYLALSYDHRVVDGREAVTLLVRVKESLEDPRRLVLDL